MARCHNKSRRKKTKHQSCRWVFFFQHCWEPTGARTDKSSEFCGAVRLCNNVFTRRHERKPPKLSALTHPYRKSSKFFQDIMFRWRFGTSRWQRRPLSDRVFREAEGPHRTASKPLNQTWQTQQWKRKWNFATVNLRSHACSASATCFQHVGTRVPEMLWSSKENCCYSWSMTLEFIPTSNPKDCGSDVIVQKYTIRCTAEHWGGF